MRENQGLLIMILNMMHSCPKKIMCAQHFSPNAERTGLFAFFCFLFLLPIFGHWVFLTMYMHYSFLFISRNPLQNQNKSSVTQTRPSIWPRYQKMYLLYTLVMLIFLLRTGTPSNSYIKKRRRKKENVCWPSSHSIPDPGPRRRSLANVWKNRKETTLTNIRQTRPMF